MSEGRVRRWLWLHSFRSPYTPARIMRLLRAPSLESAVHGDVVMVTGASSGIGRAAALRLGAAGATVLLVARTTEALEEVRAEIGDAGGTAYVHPCNLSDLDAVDRLAAEVLERHGRVDVLINNAGRSIRRPVDRAYDRAHDFERTMRLNYFAALHLILAFVPGMRERGRGQIVNISTMGTQTKAPRFSAYIASKTALDAFSTCLAGEARADGLRVTSLHYALVHTPMVAPTRVYDGAPGLTPDEAADWVAEAIRTKPARIAPRFGTLFEAGWLFAPRVALSLLSRMYRSAPDAQPTGDTDAAGTNGHPGPAPEYAVDASPTRTSPPS
jgi:NAD(P)-dependent dehydrogenase (short-subunit alcohol dehydrogenase family)